MNKIKCIRLILLTSLIMAVAPAGVLAAVAVPPTNSSNVPNAANQIRLGNLKNRGTAEINRRQITLGKMSSLINGAAKLSSTDKTNLTRQINTEVNGLKALEIQLNGETTVAAALNDVQSIYSEYRVYALLVPKIHLLYAADAELVNDSKLATLAGKLQTRITTAKTAGKDVTSLQSSLNDMNARTTAAQKLANAVSAYVAPLLPSDYNSEHTILSGQRNQLQTVHQDNVTALGDAKTIVNGLK